MNSDPIDASEEQAQQKDLGSASSDSSGPCVSQETLQRLSTERRRVLDDALETVFSNSVDRTLKTSCSQIANLLKKVVKHADGPASKRRLNTKNIILKKFLFGTEGMFEVFALLGWHYADEKEKFLVISSEHAGDGSMQYVVERLELQEKLSIERLLKNQQASASLKERVTCVNDSCSFFGDPKTEGYCSQCYKDLLSKKKSSSSASAGGDDKKQQQEEQKRCVAECGFWGKSYWEGMCSVCWKKKYPNGTLPRDPNEAELEKKKAVAAVAEKQAADKEAKRKARKQKNRKRCLVCRKKLGILGIECRCGFVFCGKHRYPEEHDCEYDHKLKLKKDLEAANKKIVGNGKFERLGH